ncbi:MAG: hypothetical protein N3C13_02895 [Aquificaceae bacterium]|nr:hypothetical protein [Aquificaceae bacterium]MCX8060127.1 hypothetical protein [Aquificaceae bacterium]MDW8097021.1 hypothetical protein [Aquificaceae bacterium]
MIGKIKHYLFQTLSLGFAVYGFYLLFLFLLDTLTRVSRPLAYPVSFGITLLLAILTLLYWIKKKRLPF